MPIESLTSLYALLGLSKRADRLVDRAYVIFANCLDKWYSTLHELSECFNAAELGQRPICPLYHSDPSVKLRHTPILLFQILLEAFKLLQEVSFVCLLCFF